MSPDGRPLALGGKKSANAGGPLPRSVLPPKVVGDYVAGPSHVMPTGGTARFSSALGVHQFLKSMPIINLKRRRLPRNGQKPSQTIARWEGLTAHGPRNGKSGWNPLRRSPLQ